MPLTPVVRNILMINVLIFLIMMMGGSGIFAARLAAYYPESPYFRPYQLVTHMFMHGNVAHIFFNMYALAILGPPLEERLGSQRFFIFYFLSGLGAIGLFFLVKYIELHVYHAPVPINVPVLGASGAVFGILAGFGTLYPTVRLMLLFPPVAMQAKYFVMLYAGLELYLGLQGLQPGVAHFAHVGGALFGFLLLKFWGVRPVR